MRWSMVFGWVRGRGGIVVLVLTVVSLALLVMAQASMPISSRPFLVFRSLVSEVDYYNVSGIGAPVLTIHAYLNNKPVPVTVSLFAYTPTRIYTVGYYYGVGTVSINLTGPLLGSIAGAWSGVHGLYPSLLAFVTYASNGTSNMRFVVLAVPYDPGWIIGRSHVAIVAVVNLTFVKTLPLPRSLPKQGDDAGVVVASGVNSSDPFSYTYLGSCVGNSEALNYPPGILGATGWVLENCYEFLGPMPLVFVSWGSGVWGSGVTGLGINMEGSTYAQPGSGFYASYALYNYSSGSYITTVTSSEPTVTFSQQTNIDLMTSCGARGSAVVYHGSSLGSECTSGSMNYYVPGSGTLFLGVNGYIALPTFYYCVVQGSSCVPIYVANGTMLLSLASGSYSSDTLYVYPYLDVGNGSVTNTLALLTNLGYAGQAFTVLDAQYFSYNPSTGQVSYTTACSNAPSPSTITSSGPTYMLQNVIKAYKPGLPGFMADVGGALAEIIADYVFELPPIVSQLIGYAISYGLSYLTASSSSMYQTYAINIATSHSTAWSFYTTFVGSTTAEAPGYGEYYWPMGLVVNASGYYLNYVPYLYPVPGNPNYPVCQG